MSDPDPHCPECGEPIGQTATYCMHCSADLADRQGDAGSDRGWGATEAKPGLQDRIADRLDGLFDGKVAETGGFVAADRDAADDTSTTVADQSTADDQILDPDGLVDNTLTMLVGIGGGIVVGLVGTFVLLLGTQSLWSLLFGLAGWLVSTVYIARQRTLQGAIAKTGYAIAVVLLVSPLAVLSPLVSVEGGLSGRLVTLGIWLFMAAIPAGIAAVVGVIAARFVPDGTT
ncbi:hypothetical protein BRC91_08765 [Halobacteriales archaeon QS_4_62_28]|nr:MAG: hypothetical protein BRC91_08765 [Halobacteriales archaeon QS_4_62_28]